MWNSGAPATSASAREVLEQCFLADDFVRLFHERCGHEELEVEAARAVGTEAWERVTRYAVAMVDASSSAVVRSLFGALATRLEETHRMELREGRLEVRCDTAVRTGPGRRLRSRTTWRVEGGAVHIECRVRYEAQGYTDRLIGSTVESMSIRRGEESLRLWWQLAQERLAQRTLLSPVSNVQRALSFESSDSDSDAETGPWEDAVSHLESPSLRGTGGMLGLLERETRLLRAQMQSLAERRAAVELAALEARPRNPLARLVRWANSSVPRRAGSVGQQWRGWAASVSRSVPGDGWTRLVAILGGTWLGLVLAWSAWWVRRQRALRMSVV